MGRGENFPTATRTQMFTITFIVSGRDSSSAVYHTFDDALVDGAEHCGLSVADAREGGSWIGNVFHGGVSEALAFRVVRAD